MQRRDWKKKQFFKVALFEPRLLSCSLVFAGISQGHWVIKHHALREICWRWPLGSLLAAVVFGLLSHLHHRFGHRLFPRSRLDVFFLVVALLPVSHLLHSALTRALLSPLLLLSAVALLLPVQLRQRTKTILLILGFGLVSGLLLATSPLSPDGVHLEVESIPLNNEYGVFRVNKGRIDYASNHPTPVLPSTSRKQVDLAINGAPEDLDIRFGGRAIPLTISRLSYTASFLFFHFPLQTWTGRELQPLISLPDPEVTGVRFSDQGVEISPKKYPHPPWIILPLARVQPC
ncbi:hypothetical protein [Desulfogranum mediterraneum]|uniref:hypothetical protein n=1 Tax=Desulfogranum mediterraneum TaxID=160661 RepID=UPI00040CFF84|nr:hypothetical protein [Desulfogranum mediterraneum]